MSDNYCSSIELSNKKFLKNMEKYINRNINKKYKLTRISEKFIIGFIISKYFIRRRRIYYYL